LSGRSWLSDMAGKTKTPTLRGLSSWSILSLGTI
jgi:hypothetical protein